METARTSSKGQIVIPKGIRDKVGLKPGTLVEVRHANGQIEIVPLPKDSIKALRGTLKGRKSLASQLIKEHRLEVKNDAKRR
jgi:AbrB family looped-hinge helix DNA binding protein